MDVKARKWWLSDVAVVVCPATKSVVARLRSHATQPGVSATKAGEAVKAE